jgi:hypothetical protein
MRRNDPLEILRWQCRDKYHLMGEILSEYLQSLTAIILEKEEGALNASTPFLCFHE